MAGRVNVNASLEPRSRAVRYAHMVEAADVLIQPELYMRDGRIIRSLADAIALLRDHEGRPGVDARDEVLHKLERAQTDDERQHAVEAFRGWAAELELILAHPEAGKR
jgi:hypothetical protein